MSIQLSSMHLAREVERQRMELNILTGMPVDFDMERGRRFLDAGGPDDLDEIIGLMRSHRGRLDGDAWLDACAALFWVATDEQVAEWKILDAVLGRIFDRFAERIADGAGADEIAKRVAGIVETTGAAIESFARGCGYKPTTEVGVLAWRTQYANHLGGHAGPDEEREAYQADAFDPADRAAFDYALGETLPPLGMYHTVACIAADLIDRYAARDGLSRVDAISTAVDVIDWAGMEMGPDEEDD